MRRPPRQARIRTTHRVQQAAAAKAREARHGGGTSFSPVDTSMLVYDDSLTHGVVAFAFLKSKCSHFSHGLVGSVGSVRNFSSFLKLDGSNATARVLSIFDLLAASSLNRRVTVNHKVSGSIPYVSISALKYFQFHLNVARLLI